jgi:vesicle-associated membrane protein 7
MQRMDHYNNNNNDPFTTINNKIHDVKDVMVQNVENLLERGEKLTLLVDKTEQLHQTAFKFERTSRHLKTTMFWRKIKLYSGIFIFFVLAIWIISSSVCGFDYSKCST